MPEAQNTGAPSALNPTAGDPTHYGKRTPEPAPGQNGQTARTVETIADKAGDTAREASRASGAILRTQAETAQQTAHASMGAGMRIFEGLTQNVSRAFGPITQSPERAEESARNVRAFSQASAALARGGQEASQAWLGLAQQTLRTNLGALSRIAACRSLPDLVAVQANLARDNLQLVLEGGQSIARASGQALEEANRAIQSTGSGARPPA